MESLLGVVGHIQDEISDWPRKVSTKQWNDTANPRTISLTIRTKSRTILLQ